MNKAFVREPDRTADYCPRCGSAGTPVGEEVVARYVPEEKRNLDVQSANFCPSPRCPVAYFDAMERFILADELSRPVYPKDPTAPICACFGLTQDDIAKDVEEGGVRRVKAILEKAKSPDARCSTTAADGQCCTAHVQKRYMQLRNGGRHE